MQKSFTNEAEFLKNLDMVSEIKPFDKFNTPRVSQLSQRSNQFNLRTVRYLEADIENISNDNNYQDFSYTLSDKYGDNGLICIVILEKKNKEHSSEVVKLSQNLEKKNREHASMSKKV